MDGEAFRMGGAHLAAAYNSGAAMEDPNQSQNQSQFLFGAKAAPLQLFGSTAGETDNHPAYYSFAALLFFPVLEPFTTRFICGWYLRDVANIAALVLCVP